MKPKSPSQRLSPLALSLTVACLVICISVGARSCASERIPVDVRNGMASSEAPPVRQVALRDPLPETPIQRTGGRINEALAVSLALGLCYSGEAVQGKIPATADALVSGTDTAGLWPPGVKLQGHTVLPPSGSVMTVRYQPSPFRLELISTPTDPKEPVLLVRLPVDAAAPFYVRQAGGRSVPGAAVFAFPQAGTLQHLPPPLTPEEDLAVLGWKYQPFSSDSLAGQ